MKNIDYYIQQSANMPNTSVGGSPSFHFGDVVLVKYPLKRKDVVEYGKPPRKNEELVAEQANKKNVKGVRTPKHLAIKRVSEGEDEVCYVLQQAAQGRSFKEYCQGKDFKALLVRQTALANAPDAHYERFVKDLCELKNLGMELKSKNLFYDEDAKNGGFTIIDLLDYSGEPFNDSIEDVLSVKKGWECLPNQMSLEFRYDGATEDEKNAGEQILLKIRHRFFLAMEKAIPDFKKHRRDVLRSMSEEELKYFEENGTVVGDLTLNLQEQKQFDLNLEVIADSAIKEIESGKSNLSQVLINKIGFYLNKTGMQNSWLYHPGNDINRNDFENEWDYEGARKEYLENGVKGIFYEKLYALTSDGKCTNAALLQARAELDEKRATAKTMRLASEKAAADLKESQACALPALGRSALRG